MSFPWEFGISFFTDLARSSGEVLSVIPPLQISFADCRTCPPAELPKADDLGQAVS